MKHVTHKLIKAALKNNPDWLINIFQNLPSGEGAPVGRTDGIIPAPCPTNADEWIAMFSKSEDEWKAMGLIKWAEELYLFPVEWYDSIPEGFRIMGASGEVGSFNRDTCSSEGLYGVLPFGMPYGTQEDIEGSWSDDVRALYQPTGDEPLQASDDESSAVEGEGELDELLAELGITEDSVDA